MQTKDTEMPVFHLKCESCGEETKVLRKSEKELKYIKCPECKGKMARLPSEGSTSRVVERIDNGWMNKAVERPADAERLYKERAAADNRRFAEDSKLKNLE